MNKQQLTDLLAVSGENYSQAAYIPWWTEADSSSDYDDYNNEALDEKTVKEAEACLAEWTGEELLSPIGQSGMSAFHFLVWLNFYDAVEQILLGGKIPPAQINTPDCRGLGITPFALACARGNLSMARLLLNHGADGSLRDGRGRNAFHFLACPRLEILVFDSSPLEKSVEQRAEIARMLDCDINARDTEGLAPLELLLSTEYSSGYTWPLTEIFLEKGAGTGYTDEEGNTLLMTALRNNHMTAALELMKHCPEMVNTPNKKGVTPLAHAADFRNQAVWLALKDHGAIPGPGQNLSLFPLSQITDNAFCDVNEENKDGLSLALYLTAKMIRQIDSDDEDEVGEVASLLHNALSADSGVRVLEACRQAGLDFTMPLSYQGDSMCLRDECLRTCVGMPVIRKLAEIGVDMEKAVIGGQTPANILASVSRRRDTDSFRIESMEFFSRESMEQLNNNGKAAIHLAAENGCTALLEVMTKKGVDINLTEDAPADAGNTALHEACLRGYPDIVRLLMEAGADDTLKNGKGETPAHLVLKKKGSGSETEKQALLLKELKNLDLPGEDGRTPFMLLDYNTADLLPLFLERGADVNRQDRDGISALMLFTDKDMTKELLRAGADLHLTDREGNTALHYALEDGAQDTARYLIRKGADYNAPNNQGITPADIAAENGYELVLELMSF